MKKLLALLLALALMLTFVACGNNDDDDDKKSKKDKESTSDSAKDDGDKDNKDDKDNDDEDEDDDYVADDEDDDYVADDEDSAEASVEEWVDINADELASIFADDVLEAEMEYEAEVTAVGTGFVATLTFPDMEETTQEEKDMLAEVFEGEMKIVIDTLLEELQKKNDNLTGFKYRVFDGAGELVLTVTAGDM